jgi:hypothetical protein
MASRQSFENPLNETNKAFVSPPKLRDALSLSTLTSQAEAALVSYLASSLPVGNHQNQSKLGERFLALWNEHTFKGPYIETLPQYEKTSSLSEMAASSASATGKDGAFFCTMRPSYNWNRIDSDVNLRRLHCCSLS